MHKYTAEFPWKNILFDKITQTLRYEVSEPFSTVTGIFNFCLKHSESKGKSVSTSPCVLNTASGFPLRRKACSS